jgi:glycosyltransferase involved in cell wall biosynthesis
MKLLVVSSWFPYPPDNGAKLRAYHLLASLAERHAITLLSFAEPGEEREAHSLTAFCETLQTVPGNPFKPARPLASRDFFSPVPRAFAQTYSRAMQALVDEAVPRHDAAVAFQLGAALYLTRHTTVPRVFDEAEAGVIRDGYRAQPVGLTRARRSLTWWKFTRFMHDLVRRFERTTVVSDVERRHLGGMGCDLARIRVVPNGVDRIDLVRRNTPKPGRLIYPGSMTYSANLDAVRYFLRETFPKIRAIRPHVSLQVTGATGDVDLRELSRGGAVTFTGHVADVKSLIAHSAVCIVPLRTGGGTRLKILESMALGTPVVSTSKGAEGLTVTPEQDILIADSPEAFAAQVVRVLDDFVLRAQLASNGRRLVERLYTWDRIGAELDDVLCEAAADHRRATCRPAHEGAVRRAAGA